MKSNYKKLGDFIQVVSIKNTNLEVTKLLGVSITKKFIPSIANTIGTDMSKYKVVKKNQFTYGSITSRNGDKISVALLEDEEAIVSTSYTVFEVINKDELLPEYLMMWFRRSEFDRYARYMSHGSTREAFGWDEMCAVELPIPSIDKQKEIVKEYHTITDRIKLNEQLNQKLENTAQSIYKEWFVNFEFPDENSKPYKSNSGEMEYSEELDMEIPKGWSSGIWGDIAIQFSGFSFKGEEYSLDEGISVVRGENVTEQRLRWDTHKKWNNPLPERAKKCFLKEYDIVIGMDGSKVGKNWSVISEYQLPLLLAQRVSCIRAKQIEWQIYLYYSMFINDFEQYVSQIHTGTSVPHISGDQIMAFPIFIPTNTTLEAFNKTTISMLNKKLINNQENHILSELKEVLLSKMATIKG